MYIDNGIVAVEGETQAQQVSTMVQIDLVFVTNIQKCNWVPSK